MAPTWDLVRLRSFLSSFANCSGSNWYLPSCFCALHPPLVNDEVRAYIHQAGTDADVSHLPALKTVNCSGKSMGNQGKTAANESHEVMAADSPKPQRGGMDRSSQGDNALSRKTMLGMSGI